MKKTLFLLAFLAFGVIATLLFFYGPSSPSGYLPRTPGEQSLSTASQEIPAARGPAEQSTRSRPSPDPSYGRKIVTPVLTHEQAALRVSEMKAARMAEHEQRLRKLGFEKLPAPGDVSLKNGPYALAPGLLALPEKGFHEMPGLVVLERAAGHVFFRMDPGTDAPEGALPVAINLATQMLGAVTGVVAIQWVSPDSGPGLATDFKLKTVQAFEDMKLGFFQSGKTDAAELMRLLQTLRKDERVGKAELEIIDTIRVAR